MAGNVTLSPTLNNTVQSITFGNVVLNNAESAEDIAELGQIAPVLKIGEFTAWGDLERMLSVFFVST